MDKAWIVLIIFGIVITGYRVLRATNESKKQEEIHSAERLEHVPELESMMKAYELDGDYIIITSGAALAADKNKRKLICIYAGKKLVLSLDEISSANLLDYSEKYIHAQKMEAYYSGVHRTSMYRPYGGHSSKEVKQGHEDFQKFNEKPVYSLELKMKDGNIRVIPFFYGDGTLFWSEADRLGQAKWFANGLNDMLSV